MKKYGFFSHLPVYIKVTKVQRRKVRREMPLFPGYVFSRLLPEERLKMLQTNLIVRTILIERPRETIHQLRQISRASRNVNAVEMKRLAHLYRAGDLVRVKTGPLMNTEGYVKYDGTKTSIVLNITILGAAVEVSISPEDVEVGS